MEEDYLLVKSEIVVKRRKYKVAGNAKILGPVFTRAQ